jgi:hypothetical protein
MKLVRKNNQIDLEAPIYMADWQFEKFKEFMKNMFGFDIEFKTVTEPDIVWEIVNPRSPIRFSVEEMFIMLQPGSIEQKVRRLRELYPNRKQWSVELKIGEAFPKYNKFLKDKGEKSVTKENVREFLHQMGWL